jgi:recombination protein RecT
MALPAFMNPQRFLRAAFTEFSKTPDLYKCTTRSLLGALIQCAQLGLEPGVLGQIYLVPFKNRRRGTVEVTVIPGYRGLLALARRSGDISTIHARPVYAGDAFTYSYGLDPKLVHEPSEEPLRSFVEKDGKRVEVLRALTHVYAACRLRDGGVQFEVMTRADVEAHRDRYAHVTAESAWATNFDEMALKTVLRRLCRLLPASTELQRAVALDAQVRHGEPQNLAALVIPDGHEDEDLGEDLEGDAAGADAEASRSRAEAPAPASPAAPDPYREVGMPESAPPSSSAPAPKPPADPPFGAGVGVSSSAPPPTDDTEVLLARSAVVAAMDRLKLSGPERALLIQQNAHVESLGAASLDGVNAVLDALTKIDEQRKARKA